MGPSSSLGRPRFPGLNCSQQDFNISVLNTLNELSSSVRILKNRTTSRHDQAFQPAASL